MSKNRLEFSRAGSTAIQTEFSNALAPMDTTFKNLQTEVETLREWWKGESADAFLKLFEDVRLEIEGEFKKWLESNQELMRQIEKIKFNGEGALAQVYRR